LVARAAIDVAFIQVESQGIDGFDLARLLRRLAPSLPVVFVADDTSRAIEAFDIGAIDFVSRAAGADRLARSLGRVPPVGRRGGEVGSNHLDATLPVVPVRGAEAAGHRVRMPGGGDDFRC
jgi:DNA-binding NarL/FixJ family response regulator